MGKPLILKKFPVSSLNLFRDHLSAGSCFEGIFCEYEWPRLPARLYWASHNASSKNASLRLFSELCHLSVLYLIPQIFSFLIVFFLIVLGTIFLFSPWVYNFVCGTKYLGLYLLPVLKMTLFLVYNSCHPLYWHAANLISVLLFSSSYFHLYIYIHM